MNALFSFRKQCLSFFPLFFSLFLFPAIALATTTVSVDHRVTLTSSEFQFDTKQFTYSTEIQVTNHSTAPILAPLRLTVSSIEGKRIQVRNAAGTGEDGLPYIEFPLPQGELAAGGTTTATLVFLRGEEMDKDPAKKMKYRNNVPFDASYQIIGGVTQAPLAPRALPYALTANNGPVPVRFSVTLADQSGGAMPLYLRQVSNGAIFPMNDLGTGGDLVANDSILGAYVTVDTSSTPAGTCLLFEAYSDSSGIEVVSPRTPVCISSFPVRIAESDATNPVTLPDGAQAVANEVMVRFIPNTSEATIRLLLTDINATVVGSLPPRNLYQLRLPSPVSTSQLLAMINKLMSRPEVSSAYPNALGAPAFTPNDTEFSSQHGLQRVRADDSWDANATGSGITVAVLDTGIDRTHADFGTVGNCQLADNDCGSPNTDFDAANGHGTRVAGVIAAKTNNATGVAGVAPDSKIKSIRIGTDVIYTIAEMIQSFLDAEAYGIASVINASFSGGPWAAVDVTDLCAAVNSAVLNGVTPVAIAINSAGNSNSNSFYYPPRCNDSTRPEHASLTRKDLYLTVANSLSTLPADSDCTPTATLDARCNNSNYGPWVDIAAPGMQIRTTAKGGGYASPTGTSFSAPIVAGAAAILRSCGVPFGQIQNTLRTSANVTVPFPDGSSAPRLDIYRALISRNRAPTGITLSNSSLDENTNTAAGVTVGNLLASDLDTCDRFTYSIVGGPDAPLFSIAGAAVKNLRLTAGVLDYETKSSYSVTVRVTDFAGVVFNQPLTVNVVNLNETPSISDQNFTLDENSVNGAVVGTAVASDPDSGDTLSYSITAGNTGGAFAINPSTGAITVNTSAAVNFEATPVFNLTVQVTDAGLLSDTATITINLNNVNEAPTLTDQVFALDENSINGSAVGTVTAVDQDSGDTISYSITAGNTGGAFAINPTTGAITVSSSAALNFEVTPAFILTVQATDGLLPSTATVTVNLNNLNEPPVLAGQVFAIGENSANLSPVGTLTASDPDAGSVISYSITAGNTGNAFAINSVSGALTVNSSAALNFETTPVFTLTVQATDAGLLSASAAVTVNLTNVNELPGLGDQTFAINENSANGTAVGTMVGSDPDSGDTLSYSIIGGNTSNAFAINPSTGAITVNSSAALNFELTPVFNLTIQVTDAGLLSNAATATINLTDVVEPIPNPILVYSHKQTGVDGLGNTVDWYFFTVANWYDFPAAMFAARPDLPPCGLNNSASRTWVDFHRSADNSRIYGFCALGTPSDLNGIWFGMVPAGTAPPASVYIRMTDRATSTVYTSNQVAVPFP